VLITVFSGSGVVVGFAFWFGFGLGVLAGFHIQVIPFAFGCCSAQALLRLLILLSALWGDNQRGLGTFITNVEAVRDNSKTAGLALLFCNVPAPLRPDAPQFQM